MSQIAKPRVRYEGLETAPAFYANHLVLSVTEADLRVLLAQLEDATGPEVRYRVVAKIFLPPQQARALRRLLTEQAAAYEMAWEAGWAAGREAGRAG